MTCSAPMKHYNLIYCRFIRNLPNFFANVRRAADTVTFTLRPVALRPLAILLALVMLVFATVADAATCGSEQAFSGDKEMMTFVHEAEAQGGDDPGNSNAPVEQHGVCAHGHCHHGSNVENVVADVESPSPLTVHLAVCFARLPSVEHEILSPPPRA